jgi:hypothetical protein
MTHGERGRTVESITLDEIVTGLARGIALADDKAPVARSARTQSEYAAGIGPHTESQTLDLAIRGLSGVHPWAAIEREVPYPALPRSRCDVCFGRPPTWEWCVEAKMLRMMGDNGKPNDNMLMHILSPYPQHRSALTDCSKLLASGLEGRKSIIIFGYDYETLAMDPAIEAFETLARRAVRLTARVEASVHGLRHPVHQRGRVFGWEIADIAFDQVS